MLRTFSFDWCVHPVIRYPILAGRRAHDDTNLANFDSIFPNDASRWFHLSTRIVTGAGMCCKHELKVFFTFTIWVDLPW